MPRDSTETRERLATAAEHLFAAEGLYRVTNREILDAAGQRNASALTYHFGSRDGLMVHILQRHGASLDVERGVLAAGLGADSSTREVIWALVEPYGGRLATQSGRDYLRIVDQLRGRLSAWRRGAASGDVYLQRLLGLVLERPAGLDPDVREQRLVSMMMLMTAAMAERARQIDDGRRMSLDGATFLANLTDMLAGIVHAPVAAPV